MPVIVCVWGYCLTKCVCEFCELVCYLVWFVFVVCVCDCVCLVDMSVVCDLLCDGIWLVFVCVSCVRVVSLVCACAVCL